MNYVVEGIGNIPSGTVIDYPKLLRDLDNLSPAALDGSSFIMIRPCLQTRLPETLMHSVTFALTSQEDLSAKDDLNRWRCSSMLVLWAFMNRRIKLPSARIIFVFSDPIVLGHNVRQLTFENTTRSREGINIHLVTSGRDVEVAPGETCLVQLPR